jgi:mRNA interferase MazF
MPTTTNFEFGDVVLVPFPFTDQTTTKRRPAVVVSSDAYVQQRPDLLILAITSQHRPSQTVGEASVQHWQQAGLIKPSVFKPLVATIERPLVIKKLGKLQGDDRIALTKILADIFGA